MTEYNAYWAGSAGFDMAFVDHGPYEDLEELKFVAVVESKVDPDDIIVVFETDSAGRERCVGVAYQGDWFVKDD